MKTMLRMKCKACGHWNHIPVNKILIEQHTSEPKVMIPSINHYKFLNVRNVKVIDERKTDISHLV